MSDIFREVDEDLRRSQAEALWKRYGGVVIALCVLLVGGTGVWRYLEWRKEQATNAAGAEFERALTAARDGKAEQADADFRQIAQQAAGAYRTLAQFRAASDLGKRDVPGAIRAFEAIAADQTADGALRDLARLRAGVLAVDVEPLDKVEERLRPLVAPTGAFRHQANELMAASAVKAGDMAKARGYLDAIIIDRLAPAELRARAEILIGVTRGGK